MLEVEFALCVAMLVMVPVSESGILLNPPYSRNDLHWHVASSAEQ